MHSIYADPFSWVARLLWGGWVRDAFNRVLIFARWGSSEECIVYATALIVVHLRLQVYATRVESLLVVFVS